MSALPASGHLSNASRTVAELKADLEAIRDIAAESEGTGTRAALTIASGVITPAAATGGAHYTIETEGGAASDALDSMALTNTHDGQVFTLWAVNASHVVTITHAAGGSGQFLMQDSAGFALNALDKWIKFVRRGTDLIELERSYGADYDALQTGMQIAQVPAHTTLCPHDGLSIAYATAATLTVAARAVVLANSAGRLKRFASLSETLNVANTGANGRDVVHNAGAEAASTWYHLWAIGKADGTLDSFAAPDCYPGSATSIFSRLPAGYTFAGYLGAAYNDVSSNLLTFQQRGDLVACAARTIVSSGSAIVLTSASLAAVVPVTAREVSGWMQIAIAAAFQSGQATMYADSAGTLAVQAVWAGIQTSVPAVGNFTLPMLTAQTAWWKVNSASVIFDCVGTGWHF